MHIPYNLDEVSAEFAFLRHSMVLFAIGRLFLKKMSDKLNTALLPHGGLVIVALSGGADSMFLLLALSEVAGSLPKNEVFEIVAAHFNHGIRENAARDEEFVKAFCEKNSIFIRCGRGDVPHFAKENGLSIETAARKLRFEFLNALRDEYADNGKKEVLIATAHHADDNVETLIMNLLRGSGMSGFSGIGERNGYIIHPLLSYGKTEIIEYMNENGIPFVHDETNDLHDALRNRVRLELVPLMEELRSNAKRNILRCSEIISTENAYLDSIISERYGSLFNFNAYSEGIAVLSFPRSEASLAPLAAKRRIARKAFEILGVYKDIEFNTIERIVDLFDGKTGQCFEVHVPNENISNYNRVKAIHEENEAEKENLSTYYNNGCGKNPPESVKKISPVSGKKYLNESGKKTVCIYLNAETVDFIVKPESSVRKAGEVFFKIDLDELSSKPTMLSLPSGRLELRIIQCSDAESEPSEGNEIKQNLMNGVCCSKDIGYLDAGRLGENLFIRRRKSGDTFFPVNAPGRKKLKDIFINAKLPAIMRDELPIVESDGEIVFVPKIRPAESVKVEKSTNCILEIAFSLAF